MDQEALLDKMIDLAIKRYEDLPVNQEYFSYEDKYIQLFGHGIAREMLPDSITDNDIMCAMQTCIERKKDNFYELLDIQR